MQKVYVIILLFVGISSCTIDSYDPTKPHPIMNTGDSWLENYEPRKLQNTLLDVDKFYCSTFEVNRPNQLYCLSLKTGKVIWRVDTKSPSSFPVLNHSQGIYFVSSYGDIYSINDTGTILWQTEFPSSVGEGPTLNPNNQNLIVPSVADGIYEFNQQNGEINWHKGQSLIGVTKPVFDGQNLILGNFGLSTGTKNESICKVETNSDSIIWKTQIERGIDQIIELDSTFITISFMNGNEISHYSKSTGTELWNYEFNRDPTMLGCTVVKSSLICKTTDHFALDISSGKNIEFNLDLKCSTFSVQQDNGNFQISVCPLINQMEEYEIQIMKN